MMSEAGNGAGAREKEPPFRPGDRVAVLGLGSSGIAASRLVHARGGEVYASDLVAGGSQQEAAEALREEGIDAEAGGHDVARILECDLVVASPGVAPSTEIRREVREGGIRTIAEIELAFRFLTSRIIAITGTNGKTTTTALCGHLLDEADRRSVTAGNIGMPLSEVALREDPPEWVVVEVSSFQLADIDCFRPDIGVMLNLAPDHMDRYRNLDSYYADKQRIFLNAGPDSRWVLNAEDEDVMNLARSARGHRYFFSTARRPPSGAYVDDQGTLRLQIADRSESWLAVEKLRLVGRHNVANALAAGLAAALAGCAGEEIARGLSTFEALPHRLQPVARCRDRVLWVNDSKATNVSATAVALRAFERPLVLLLGGRGKGEPYARLIPLMQGHVRGVIAFGEAAPQIVSELADAVPTIRTESGIDAVVDAAAEIAEPGDVVLFSPACSSYDMFPDYAARGEAFEVSVGRHLETREVDA